MKYFHPYTIVCLKEDELKEKACHQQRKTYGLSSQIDLGCMFSNE